MKATKSFRQYWQKLVKKPKSFRRLTGISPDKFSELAKQLQPLYEGWNQKRLSGRKRKRKIGGGNKHTLVLHDRLLTLLIYYRSYVTYEFLSFIFGIAESSIGRNFKPLEPLLAQIFRIPERKVHINEDEFMAVFFDGTEQERERPQKRQRRHYSGKKKKHTIKHQIAVVKKKKTRGRWRQKRKLRIAAVSRAFAGRIHDKKMYDKTRVQKPPEASGFGDSAYQGAVLKTPHRKRKGRELAKRQKQSNIRHSSQRVCAEHGIGKMKIWRIVRDTFRNQKTSHTLIMKNVAGFHNLMFA